MPKKLLNDMSSHPRNSFREDAIALATISALAVHFTDICSIDTVAHSSVSWNLVLWISGINPLTISRLWQVIMAPRYGGAIMSQKQKRFICHELIHTITGFYHYFPSQGLVWMAIINFPLWFAHLDLCMREKELITMSASGKDMSRKIKQSTLVAQHHDPLVFFSSVLYMFGVVIRGQRFLLSGAGVAIMSLPFMRRKAAFSVAATVPPLVVLFGLEHYTIMNELDTLHNVVHSVSHIVLHVAVNNLFKHHVV